MDKLDKPEGFNNKSWIFQLHAAAIQRIFISLVKMEVCQTTKTVSEKIQVQ